MHIDLDERPLADAAEAVNFSRLDDQNVARGDLELLSIHQVQGAPLPDELDLVVRVAMGPWALSREGAEEKGGDIDAAMIGAGEPMRAALKRQVLLADSVHLTYALEWVESAAVRAMNQFGTPRTGACATTSNPNRS